MMSNVKKILLFSSMLLMVMAGCSGKNGHNGINGTDSPVLSSVPVSNEGVRLTWSQPYGASGYTVYSSAVSGGPFSALGTTTTTRYLVNNLPPGATYYFVVTAQISSGESPYSNVVSFRSCMQFTYMVGNSPFGIAIDASGNVWVANNNDNTVSEITPTTGSPQTTTIPVGSGPMGIAIDQSGNVWVTNENDGTISEIAGDIAMTPTTGLMNPVAIAIDQAGDIWVTTPGSGSLTMLDASGSVLQGIVINDSDQPVAIDASGNVWAGSYGGGTVSEVTTHFTGYTYDLGYNNDGLAIDQSGNVWVSDENSGSIYEITSTTSTPVTTTVIRGLIGPQGIAIDQAGNVWVVNVGSNNVTEISPAGIVLATYSVGNAPLGLAIDASGDVWVTNNGDGTVTELVGLAQGPQYFPCQYSTAAGNTCPQFQGGGNWGWP